ncbi:WD repeat-containing protein 55 homolog [Aphis gossypii]|uniref:WD repeat-containing protein 55 homolog n=1 Tax=Aphis gossypii TaxID=80765 RepID=A0A9P0JBG3_APHGO|nr:WD repeat-containing protein 55 homolog [Aphis gossypii]CAH1733012.1 unnamed protein product [Aphis gossypii]
MCIPDLRVPLDDYAIPDNEGVFEEPQRGEDIYYSDYESSSDSSSDDNDDDNDIEELDDNDDGEENNDGGSLGDDDNYDQVDEELFAYLYDVNSSMHPNTLFVGSTVGALSFLPDPSINIIALGLSNGVIKMYLYDDIDQQYLRAINDVHLNKITVLEFDETGEYIYSACKDNNVSVSDVETGQLKAYFEEAHTAGSFVTALSFIDENVFATGGKDGVVNVWDIRASGCRFSLKKSEDSIDSMITINDSNNQPTLACTTGDGTLTIFDLSTKKIVIQSEPYKSVLTSCVTMKQKTKVVCGTGVGSLITFNTGDFNAFHEEFPCFDKDAAVTRLVPLTENIIINALDNGNIRATHLFPNSHLGIVGQHQNKIDLLGASPNGEILVSTTPFSVVVAFWYTELHLHRD